MTALLIGEALLFASGGALIGLKAGNSPSATVEEAVGWTSVVFLGVGLFAVGYGLARVFA